MGFYLIYMVQIIFVTCAIQIFAVLPERVKRGTAAS